ncbi:translation initiation factor IF-3 [Rickettsiales bacterium]|nr:translation initiation factor IF-3 [Rickettsiales bacterium]
MATTKELNINHKIKAKQVRFIDADGKMVGVVPLSDALDAARELGLDLVEINPNSDPPVCKVIDYSKYKYTQNKKTQESKKKQRQTRLKEIKLRPNIGVHDYNIKLKSAHSFIQAGDRVKVSVRFRGREMLHQDIGRALLKRLEDDLSDIAKPEAAAKQEGKQLILVLIPAK